MKIVEWFKKIFFRKKDYMLKENETDKKNLIQTEELYNRDELAIEISKEELVDFGILNKYEFDCIEYITKESITEEEIEIKKREIINGYKKHLDEINKKIFHKMHYHLLITDYNIWEYKGFEKIINKDMLPNDFYSLDDEQKREILYLDNDYNYNELWEKIQEIKPFWNLNNIKDDINITNVVIDADYKNINIEFKGMCDFFAGFIELNYDKDYEIIVFDPS